MKESDLHDNEGVVIEKWSDSSVKYEHELRVTFGHTNAEGNVSHD